MTSPEDYIQVMVQGLGGGKYENCLRSFVELSYSIP